MSYYLPFDYRLPFACHVGSSSLFPPPSPQVQLFVRTAFGCPLFQGYGLTETCAGLSMQDPSDLRTGIAGVPLTSCEVKLESCPDVTDKAKLPYLSTDKRDVDGNRVHGRGEIMVRGANISKGYYMMEDKTKEEVRMATGRGTPRREHLNTLF